MISSFETRTPSSRRSRDLNDSDRAILAALEDSPFASEQQLSRLTRLPSTTVYRRPTQLLGFVARHLRWVPHALSDAQKSERVNLSRRLLRMLEVQRDRAWHDIVTLHESWFYLSTGYKFLWLPRDEKVPERGRHAIQLKKFILTVIWNPRGFHLIKILEKYRKFNAGYYSPEILKPLSQWYSIEAAGNERKLLVHAGNARSHTAKLSTQHFNENQMKSAPHPPYSPDLAPSDFSFVGYLKRCRAGLSFEEQISFLQR
jgi:histone-lysine N-methyltransferase SETMAR